MSALDEREVAEKQIGAEVSKDRAFIAKSLLEQHYGASAKLREAAEAYLLKYLTGK